MKKLYLLVIILIILPISVGATGGALRKASIKTCPNGVTYGMHSDGNGATHWHVAVTNGKSYYASGSAIASDPCPSSTINQGTAGSTSGNENNNTTTAKNNNSTDSSSNTNSSNNNNNNKEDVVKSSDNTIKKVTINSSNVEIKDEMTYSTTKDMVDVSIELNNDKASYTFENKDLVEGNNYFDIVVTAENGDVKTYKLNIFRILVLPTIKSLKLNDNDIIFSGYKVDYSIDTNTTSIIYDYVLSDDCVSIKIYLNDIETLQLDNIKTGDVIKFVLTGENGKENIYTINIIDYVESNDNSNNEWLPYLLLFGIFVVGFFLLKNIFLD